MIEAFESGRGVTATGRETAAQAAIAGARDMAALWHGIAIPRGGRRRPVMARDAAGAVGALAGWPKGGRGEPASVAVGFSNRAMTSPDEVGFAPRGLLQDVGTRSLTAVRVAGAQGGGAWSAARLVRAAEVAPITAPRGGRSVSVTGDLASLVPGGRGGGWARPASGASIAPRGPADWPAAVVRAQARWPASAAIDSLAIETVRRGDARAAAAMAAAGASVFRMVAGSSRQAMGSSVVPVPTREGAAQGAVGEAWGGGSGDGAAAGFPGRFRAPPLPHDDAGGFGRVAALRRGGGDLEGAREMGGREGAPVTLHTTLHLDGTMLAQAVSAHVVGSLDGPLGGTGGFDARRSYTPVET